MKLKALWAMAILVGGSVIASCASETATSDDDDTTTTTSSGTAGNNTGGNNTGGSGLGTGGSGLSTGGNGGGGASMPGCHFAVECTDPNSEVCDVETEDCVATECDPSQAQPAGCTGSDPYCLEQHPLSAQGACYNLCDPYDAPCGAGMECVSVSIGQEIGVCLNPGGGAIGAACNPAPDPDESWGTSTGCALGSDCYDRGSGNLCYETCDFFGTPACAGATVCHPGGICDAPVGGTYDADPLEGGCAGATGGEMCGLVAPRDGYEGECRDLGDGAGMACHAYCDAVGKYTCGGMMDACYDVFGPPWQGSVGLCARPPASGCTAASECADPMTDICDVESESCSMMTQCDPDAAQPGGCVGTDPACIQQDPNANAGIGACYETCDPYSGTACPGPNATECRNNTYSQSWGLCLNAGVGTTGNDCSPLVSTSWGTTTGCAAGNICWGNVCRQVCDFFGSPTCAGATLCHLFGVCDEQTNSGYDTVDVGQPCVGAMGGEDCGYVGNDGYQGACNEFPLDDTLGMVCRPFCTFDHNTCLNAPWDTICYDVFADPLAGDVGTCIGL